MNKKLAIFTIASLAVLLPICLAFAADGDFRNPLNFSTVEGLLGAVLSRLQAIIAILAIIFIVIGGIMYITSAGETGKIESAKKTITFAMIGLAIAIAAPSFLLEISVILNWTDPCEGAADVAACEAALGDPLTLSQIALNFLHFLLVMIGTLSIMALVVGGLIYITSSGDEDKADTAKKTIKYAIVGLVVALSSMVIVNQIAKLLANN